MLTTINLYLVDDMVLRVCLLRDLIVHLNRHVGSQGIRYVDGFGSRRGAEPLQQIGEVLSWDASKWARTKPPGERKVDTAELRFFDAMKASNDIIRGDAKAIAMAMRDPCGLILLDIALTPEEQTDEAIRTLMIELGVTSEEEAAFDQEWAGLECDPIARKAVLILTVAIRRKRPIVLISSAADSLQRRFAPRLQHLGVPLCEWLGLDIKKSVHRNYDKYLDGCVQPISRLARQLRAHDDLITRAAIELFCQPWASGWKDHEGRARMWHHNYLDTEQGREPLRNWLGCAVDPSSAKGLLMTAWNGPEAGGVVWPEFTRDDCRPVSGSVLRKVLERLDIRVETMESPVDYWLPVTPGLPWLVALRALLWWIANGNDHKDLPQLHLRGERASPSCNVFTFSLSLQWNPQAMGSPWQLANNVDELRREYEARLARIPERVAEGSETRPPSIKNRGWYGLKLDPRKEGLSGHIVRFLHAQVCGLRTIEGPFWEPLWQLDAGRSVPVVQVEWPTATEMRLRWFGKRR